MIRRNRGTRYPATTRSTGSDTDELQTDVMRFMSILGLCLMAVFALVQSIPVQEQDRLRSQPELDTLQQAVALQQDRAHELQADLDRLTADVENAQQRRDTAERALSATQQQLTRLADQAQQARRDRDALLAELQTLQDQLTQARDELTRLRQAAREPVQSPDELRQRLAVAQAKLADTARRATALEATAPPAPVRAQRPAPPRAAQQGFTLRFASAEALQRLVASGAVSLYAMAGKQAWRLSPGDGAPVFAPDKLPNWFHEMEPSTVPPGYAGALAQAAGRAMPSPVVWGVQLPPATRQGIASLTRGLSGGNLLIGADGRVTLEPE